jgi:hypothetical protein
MSSINNILSYFIKDIKDSIELGFYKQTNSSNLVIIIEYKSKNIFVITPAFIYKYNCNMSKSRLINNNRVNYKIANYENYKNLYYKHDKNIKDPNGNYISFLFICKKYLVKTDFKYIINTIIYFITKVKYLNGYKYISKQYRNNDKYTNNIILIKNKYELYYYNKFFDFYFGSK